MLFAPTDDHKLLVEAGQKLARALAQAARATERSGLAGDLASAARELGLGFVHVPEAHGGAGLGLLESVLLEEEVAAGDAATAFALGGSSVFALAMAELGDGGSAGPGAVAFGEARPHPMRGGLSTVAVGNELTGEKAYVLGAERAERFVVFAQVNESRAYDGVGAFLVERGPGVTVTPRVRTLGLDAAEFAGLSLQGARATLLTTDGEKILRLFVKLSVLNAARAVGLARAAFEVTRSYVEQRRAFGKPVAHFQAVAFTVADRAIDVDAARALVWKAAWSWDEHDAGALLASARAISCALETSMRAADDAVQLHGGAGFMRDHPVEKYMRDAKQLALYGMPAACADQLAAALELGREPDLALVLPWADSQSAFL